MPPSQIAKSRTRQTQHELNSKIPGKSQHSQKINRFIKKTPTQHEGRTQKNYLKDLKSEL